MKSYTLHSHQLSNPYISSMNALSSSSFFPIGATGVVLALSVSSRYKNLREAFRYFCSTYAARSLPRLSIFAKRFAFIASVATLSKNQVLDTNPFKIISCEKANAENDPFEKEKKELLDDMRALGCQVFNYKDINAFFEAYKSLISRYFLLIEMSEYSEEAQKEMDAFFDEKQVIERAKMRHEFQKSQILVSGQMMRPKSFFIPFKTLTKVDPAKAWDLALDLTWQNNATYSLTPKYFFAIGQTNFHDHQAYLSRKAWAKPILERQLANMSEFYERWVMIESKNK